ncbi:MAG: hypothetical protein GY943_30575 [Chloroflexi bacterium]|nr:hypothetical protein [Chloroflexota bacterium]
MASTQKLFPVILLRNYRPLDPKEDRHVAGERIEVPVAEARVIVSKGIAKRDDPME